MASLGELQTSIDPLPSAGVVWYVLAAWESEEKRWCGTEFGFGDYVANAFSFTDFGPCYPPTGGLEIPTPGWPGPLEGTAFVVTGDPWAGNYLPVYFFTGVAYNYYGAQVIAIAADPATGFVGFSNCTSPPQSFELPPEQLGGPGISDPGYPPVFPIFPLGACCLDPGVPPYLCEMLIESECLSFGGVWLEEESCLPVNPCEPVEGACCVSGLCSVLTEEGCALIGGVFQGSGTSCVPNPCQAVCCFWEPAHLCLIVLEDECAAYGGYWHPEWSYCVPNPCNIYTPTQEASWGDIKRMYK